MAPLHTERLDEHTGRQVGPLVLIVVAYAPLRMLLSVVLAKGGYRVHATADAWDAIQRLAGDRPDAFVDPNHRGVVRRQPATFFGRLARAVVTPGRSPTPQLSIPDRQLVLARA
jgi:hypothetical protein